MSELDALRDDHAGALVLNEAAADLLADRMVLRFHEMNQRLKGGTLQGGPGPNPRTKNQWGGKGIIKFNPSNSEINAGIRQQQSLLVWESPDGLPHYVTCEVGRFTGGYGGPGADNTKGGIQVISPNFSVPGTINAGGGQGSVGGGSWPATQDANGNPLYYRAAAQVTLGTPGTMEDQFFIDINRGQRFTALASYVAITAQMLSPPIDELTGNVVVPITYQNPGNSGIGPAFLSGSLAVYATLGMAVAPSLAPVLYTQYIDYTIQNALGTGVFNSFVSRVVPPRANTVFPVLSSSPGNGKFADLIQLIFFDVNGATVAETPRQPNGSQVPPIVIPEDCYGVQVGTVWQTAYRLIYQLSV